MTPESICHLSNQSPTRAGGEGSRVCVVIVGSKLKETRDRLNDAPSEGIDHRCRRCRLLFPCSVPFIFLHCCSVAGALVPDEKKFAPSSSSRESSGFLLTSGTRQEEAIISMDSSRAGGVVT